MILFFGILLIIFGYVFALVPIVGWIVAPIAIVVGWIMVIWGIISLIIGAFKDDDDKEIVYHDFDHPLNEKRREQRVRDNSQQTNTYKTTPADELEKISKLYEKGHLSKEEFEKAKEELLKNI